MIRTDFFKEELSKITNENLKEFTKSLIDNADDYFFFIPASTTGKHHPPFDRELGGLIKHSKVVAYTAYTLGVAHGLPQEDLDLLIIAGIAHDIKKIGTGASGHTMKNHPEQAVEFIKEIYSSKGWEIEENTINQICNCVLCHMGRWGKNKPSTTLELIVHSADYLASREELLAFDFGEIPDIDEKEIGEVIIPFGKHKGISIKELCDKQTGYVRWIKNDKEFFNPTYKNLILAYERASEPDLDFNLE